MNRVIIADDHVVIRQGLRALLSKNGDWEVVGEASDGLAVLAEIEKYHPDIVILDLAMPGLGGVETIARLTKMQHSPAVLVLSARDDENSVSSALRAGARGFIPKSSSMEELQFALEALRRGQTYISPSVCAGVLNRGPGEEGASPLAILSNREREVMKLLCEGQPNRDVARLLHISPRTVDTHRTNIMRKLGVKSNAELVQLALRTGLIE
jgi:two-component system invasion response regulator UvrY